MRIGYATTRLTSKTVVGEDEDKEIINFHLLGVAKNLGEVIRAFTTKRIKVGSSQMSIGSGYLRIICHFTITMFPITTQPLI